MNEWSILWEAREAFLQGTLTTLLLFVLATGAAFVLGCGLLYGLEEARLGARLLRYAINFMRMMPFLVLVYLLYYGLPQLGLRLSAWWAGLLALALYHAAYFAEILRGARATFPVGQVEAGLAQGFSPPRLYGCIVLPQLILRSRSLLGNQLIYALKDTAFLTIITVQELTAVANSVQATYFIPTQAFVVVIALYWLISVVLALALRWATRIAVRRGFEHG